MESKKSKIRLGIFLSITISFLIIIIAILVGQEIFQKRKNYYIKYTNTSVRGLEVGSAVKYQGLKVGQVKDIIIDERDLENIIVEINIREQIPIKEDVKATLVYSGITGQKQLELSGGSDTTDVLPPGSYIDSEESALTNITGRAEIIANKTEHLLNNLTNLTSGINRAEAEKTLTNIENISGTLNSILNNNQKEIQNIIINFENISKNFSTISDTATVAINSLNNILKSPELNNTIGNLEIITNKLSQIEYDTLGRDTRLLVNNLNTTVENLNNTLDIIELTVLRNRQDVTETIRSLEETSSNLRDFSREIKDNPGVLLRSRKRK